MWKSRITITLISLGKLVARGGVVVVSGLRQNQRLHSGPLQKPQAPMTTYNTR